MTSLHIRLLGDFAMDCDGELIAAVHGARLQSVLAYLLLHSRTPQPRQHLAFQLWPDSSERQARNNLRKVLHQLRNALPDADRLLYVDDHAVQWRPNIAYTLDVTEFKTKLSQANDVAPDNLPALQSVLAEAVALYHGDLLPSCYDEWITSERERLRQAFMETLERLMWLAEDQRDYAAAIHHAQQLLQRDPLHEATYRRLMRLYMVDGNRASALRTYHACSVLLQRELGVEPGVEIQQAYTHLLEMEVPAVLRTLPHQTAPSELRLAGRQTEWKTVRAAWQKATRGQPHFCLISGEAGIGKTRLAEELLTWVERQGIATTRTRAYAAGRGLAYAPVIEWLQSKPLQAALTALDDIRLVEVARLLPDLLDTRPILSHPTPLAGAELSQWQRQRLFDALTRLFLDNQEPKLLLIDDLQWCDGETLAWLHYFFSAMQSAGGPHNSLSQLLIVGTVRPEEVDAEHPLTALLLDLRGADRVTEIALAPLGLTEAAELAAQVADTKLDEAAIQHIFTQTEGNPLFIVETVRAGVGPVQEHDEGETRSQSEDSPDIFPPLPLSSSPTKLPSKVLAVIQSRLVQLSPGAHQLACVAAVIGRSFTFELLQAVSAEEESGLVNSLDELWQRGIVRTHGGQAYDFSHDRIREVAYSEVGPVQRPHLHRRIANSLHQLHNGDLNQVAAQLATHYDAAGASEEAITWSQRAAEVQRQRYAVPEAIAYLKWALELLADMPQSTARKEQELTMLLDLSVDLSVAVGFGADEQLTVLNRAVKLAEEVNDNARLYYCLVNLRGHYLSKSGPTVALDFSPQLLRVGKATGDPMHLAGARYMVARAYIHHGEFQYSHTLLAQAYSPFASTTHSNVRGVWHGTIAGVHHPKLCANLGLTLWLLGYPEQACTWIDEALQCRIQEKMHLFHDAATLHFSAIVFRALQEVARVQPLVEQLIMIGMRYGQNLAHLNGLNFQGWVLAEQGDFAASIDSLTQGIAGFRAMNQTMFQTYRLAILAEVYVLANDLTAAAAILEEAFAISARGEEFWWDAELHRIQGNLYLAQGVPFAQVERCYEQAIEIAQQQQAKSLELRAAMSLARLWQQQGKVSEAHAYLSTIYNWFTEGFRTADLQAARNLLSELS